MQKLSDLEKTVFLGRELVCKESKLLAITNLSVFYMPKDEHCGAVVRINIEFQGQVLGSPESRRLLNEEYRTNKKAYNRYCEINEKLRNGKYVLDLGLPTGIEPSINFLQ